MIFKLYNTQIICSKYNVIKNEKINITVKCMGFDDNPVISEEIKVYYDNNTLIGSGVTDNKGEFIINNYTLSDYGLHTISANNISMQVQVEREIHPVGSIYISVSDISPSELFGGVWEKIEGKFLLANSSDYPLGSTGGSATHSLTVAQLPSHNHTQSSHNHGTGGGNRFVIVEPGVNLGLTAKRKATATGGTLCYLYGNKDKGVGEYSTTASTAPAINYTGSGQAHNNMPPYLVVSVWKRIS